MNYSKLSYAQRTEIWNFIFSTDSKGKTKDKPQVESVFSWVLFKSFLFGKNLLLWCLSLLPKGGTDPFPWLLGFLLEDPVAEHQPCTVRCWLQGGRQWGGYRFHSLIGTECVALSMCWRIIMFMLPPQANRSPGNWSIFANPKAEIVLLPASGSVSARDMSHRDTMTYLSTEALLGRAPSAVIELLGAGGKSSAQAAQHRLGKLPLVCHAQLTTHRIFPHLTPVFSTHLLADGEKKQWILLIQGIAVESWAEQTAGCGGKNYSGAVTDRQMEAGSLHCNLWGFLLF